MEFSKTARKPKIQNLGLSNHYKQSFLKESARKRIKSFRTRTRSQSRSMTGSHKSSVLTMNSRDDKRSFRKESDRAYDIVGLSGRESRSGQSEIRLRSPLIDLNDNLEDKKVDNED